jgi:hypothetical protein
MTYKIRKVADTDYRRMLRRFFDVSEVQQLITAGKRIAWPRLNKKAAIHPTVGALKKRSEELGIEMVVGEAELSKEVLGFYLPETSRLLKPLIWLDGRVKHMATLGATFLHETGHHIVGQTFGQSTPLNTLDRSSSVFRIYNREEIAADVFVSLAGMPHRTAMAMFGPGRDAEDLKRVFRRMCRRYEISAGERVADEEDLLLLVGALHYVKLREALLTEFGV